MTELHLEGTPDDDQKHRLDDFLTELAFITRKYRIVLDDPGEHVEVRDLARGTLVGVGLAHFTSPARPDHVSEYVPVDSILDGSWLVDTPDGPREQYRVTNVFPLLDA